jgi:hypothetical protein
MGLPWWMFREQLARADSRNALTTTGNACTGNARLPGGKTFAQGASVAQGCRLAPVFALCRLAWSNEDWRSAARVGGVHGSTTQDAVIFFRTTPDCPGTL